MVYGPAMIMGHDGANAMVPPPMPPLPPPLGTLNSTGYPLIPPPGAYPSPPQSLYKLPPPPSFLSPLLLSQGFQPPPHPVVKSPTSGGPLSLPLPDHMNIGSALPNFGPVPFNNENQRPRETSYRDETRRLSITNLVLEPIENCNNTVKIDVVSGGKYQVRTTRPCVAKLEIVILTCPS